MEASYSYLSGHDLDPTAPRPLELLGDVNAAMGRQAGAIEQYQAYLAIDDRAPRVGDVLARTMRWWPRSAAR